MRHDSKLFICFLFSIFLCILFGCDSNNVISDTTPPADTTPPEITSLSFADWGKARHAGVLSDTFSYIIRAYDENPITYSWYIDNNKVVNATTNLVTLSMPCEGSHSIYCIVSDGKNQTESDHEQAVIYPSWLSGMWSSTIKTSTVDCDNYYFDEEITNQYQNPEYHYIQDLKYISYTWYFDISVTESSNTVFQFSYSARGTAWTGWLRFSKIDSSTMNVTENIDGSTYGPFKYKKVNLSKSIMEHPATKTIGSIQFDAEKLKANKLLELSSY